MIITFIIGNMHLLIVYLDCSFFPMPSNPCNPLFPFYLQRFVYIFPFFSSFLPSLSLSSFLSPFLFSSIGMRQHTWLHYQSVYHGITINQWYFVFFFVIKEANITSFWSGSYYMFLYCQLAICLFLGISVLFFWIIPVMVHWCSLRKHNING